MPPKKRFPCSGCGFTLVELAIVLAIVGIVIAGIWTAAAVIVKRNREEKTVQYLLQMVQGIRRLYANQPDNAGIDRINMIAAGVVPAEIVASPTSIKNLWGGAGDITVAGGTTQFTIGFNTIPRSSCIALIMRTSVNPNEIGLVSISVQGVTTPAANMPINNAAATTACSNTTSLGNTIRWTYQLRN